MIRGSRILVAWLTLCGAADTALAAGELGADELIEKWAAAMGGREAIAKVSTVYSRSSVSVAGLSGTVIEWSTAQGEFRQELELGGVFSTQTVFNGNDGWVRDQNGKVKELQGVELENQLTSAYFSSSSQFVPGRRAGQIQALGRDDSGKSYRLGITPEGGKPVTVYLDATTFLPARQERPADDRTETTFFEDWRTVDGLLAPFSIRVSTGDPQYDAVLKVEEIRVDSVPPDGAFNQPQEGPKDFRFTSGSSALGIPFELNSNHIYVQAQVNGGEWLWFIFDTGAGATVLDRGRAEALQLPLQGQLEGRGAGEGSVAVAMIPGASFSLPGVELVDQTIMAIPLGMVSPYEGRPVDGVLGYDLISRFVVKIDYAGRRLDLFEPATFVYSGTGERIPLLLEDNHPHVIAEVKVGDKKPVKGNFLIDTGARTALHLSRPFCEEHGFTDAVRTIVGGFGAGVGGETRQQIGRAAELTLGNIVLTEIITGFSQDEKGAGASRETSGIIGGDVMRRFTVIFDYSRHEMILEPNAHKDEPFEYDMCGAFLRTTTADFSGIEIHRLIAGSPAEAAGLREGDVILAIDGRPAGEFTLEDVRGWFVEEGRTMRIEYRRGEERGEVTLTTKRLI